MNKLFLHCEPGWGGWTQQMSNDSDDIPLCSIILLVGSLVHTRFACIYVTCMNIINMTLKHMDTILHFKPFFRVMLKNMKKHPKVTFIANLVKSDSQTEGDSRK